MKPVLVVVGTRPEAIKLAPVIHALRDRPDGPPLVVCSTGQHRELLDDVLATFDIIPDARLDVMRENQSLHHVAGTVILRMEAVLDRFAPGLVVVQGDTTSAAMAALAAFYSRCPVAHDEAGLRSFDKWFPYPEEVNRRWIDNVADLQFAPTEAARQNLLREGIPADSVEVTGNTVIDAFVWARDRIRSTAGASDPASASVWPNPEGRRVVLVTAHRRESFGEGMAHIARALVRLAAAVPDIDILFSIHPNPNVRRTVLPIVQNESRIHVIEPVGYLQFVDLLDRATLIVTDSGGIQEEATFLGKPTLVSRALTERTEAVEAGVTEMVGADEATIAKRATALLTDREEYARMAVPSAVFGDGQAAKRIADRVSAFLRPA